MRLLPKGIYTPLPCFFKDNEDLDLDAFASHVKFVATAGTIPVVSGSMGEAVHLDRNERKQLVRTARGALDDAGLSHVALVAGAGAPSTRESIALARDAAAAGADFVMVIPPGYYAGALMADQSAAIREFFIQVADASPVPVILYNFPAVSSGIDVDSDLVVSVVRASPNVCAIKLTCANVGKLTRILAETGDRAFVAEYPRSHGQGPFAVIDGFIDFLLPSVAVGAAGAISGLPNIAPLACVKLWTLCQALDTPGAREEARELQNVIALADGVALKMGISGMKKLLNRHFGYGPLPRRPLLPMGDDRAAEVFASAHLARLLALEEELRKAGDTQAST